MSNALGVRRNDLRFLGTQGRAIRLRELGLKGIVGQVIQLRRRNEDWPDRDRLGIGSGRRVGFARGRRACVQTGLDKVADQLK